MVGILRNESCTLQKEKRPAASVVKSAPVISEFLICQVLGEKMKRKSVHKYQREEVLHKVSFFGIRDSQSREEVLHKVSFFGIRDSQSREEVLHKVSFFGSEILKVERRSYTK
nr:hypothetical protein BgiMline_000508 [Biomphalaria glabrata]